jgi:hypothetical protein
LQHQHKSRAIFKDANINLRVDFSCMIQAVCGNDDGSSYVRDGNCGNGGRSGGGGGNGVGDYDDNGTVVRVVD